MLFWLLIGVVGLLAWAGITMKRKCYRCLRARAHDDNTTAYATPQRYMRRNVDRPSRENTYEAPSRDLLTMLDDELKVHQEIYRDLFGEVYVLLGNPSCWHFHRIERF